VHWLCAAIISFTLLCAVFYFYPPPAFMSNVFKIDPLSFLEY
jgi:hypothetical protein